MRTAVLLPVKGFADAKVRLAPALGPEARAALARRMAEQVVAAAGSLAVHVVCDDAEVVEWAAEVGARVVWAPNKGLNGAVTFGVETLAAEGFGRVVVAHADLPMALDLTWLSHFPGITLVPDRHDDGTNVMAVPVDRGFCFAYGAGSFRRHVAEARRVGCALRIGRRSDLAWDVDLPADLAYCPT